MKNIKLIDAILNTDRTDGILKRLADKDKQLAKHGYDLQNEFRRGFIMAEDIVKAWAEECFPLNFNKQGQRFCSYCGYAEPNHEDNCKNNPQKEIHWLKEKLKEKESNNCQAFAEWLGDGFERLAITPRWQCFSDKYCGQYKLSLDTTYTTRELYKKYQNGKAKQESQKLNLPFKTKKEI